MSLVNKPFLISIPPIPHAFDMSGCNNCDEIISCPLPAILRSHNGQTSVRRNILKQELGNNEANILGNRVRVMDVQCHRNIPHKWTEISILNPPESIENKFPKTIINEKGVKITFRNYL